MALHAARVVLLVRLPVVRLLEADHTVETGAHQLLILLCLKGLYLQCEVGEHGAGHAQHLLQVVDATQRRVLATDHQQILERAELLDGLALLAHIVERQCGPLELVVVVEAAVHALIGAGIGDVHGDVHAHSQSEAAACNLLT